MMSVQVTEVFNHIESSEFILIDIRGAVAWKQGTPKYAKILEAEEVSQQQDKLLKKHQIIYLLCFKGELSRQLSNSLNDCGSNRFVSVDGGYAAWLENKLPVDFPNVSDWQCRYERQIKLTGFGINSQQLLQQSHVLVVGAGGLGSSALLYLCASGVGEITVIDDDVVELSNLHRQIIHTEHMLGLPKVHSVNVALSKLNSSMHLNCIEQRLDWKNARKLIEQVDVVLDGSDNLSTRYLVNDVCYSLKKPLIFAAVHQYEAHISVFDFREEDSACYRCVFPKADMPEPMNCSQIGVLGVTPGMAGIMQATECIKLISSTGQVSKGKMLLFNLLDNEYKVINYHRNESCSHGEGS